MISHHPLATDDDAAKISPICLSAFVERTIHPTLTSMAAFLCSIIPGAFRRRAINGGSRHYLAGTGSTQNRNTPATKAATARSVAGSLGAFQHGSYYFTTTSMADSKNSQRKPQTIDVQMASQKTLPTKGRHKEHYVTENDTNNGKNSGTESVA